MQLLLLLNMVAVVVWLPLRLPVRLCVRLWNWSWKIKKKNAKEYEKVFRNLIWKINPKSLWRFWVYASSFDDFYGSSFLLCSSIFFLRSFLCFLRFSLCLPTPIVRRYWRCFKEPSLILGRAFSVYSSPFSTSPIV